MELFKIALRDKIRERAKKNELLKRKFKLSYNIIKISRKYFHDFRKHLFSKIRRKYNYPYILSSFPKEDIRRMSKEQIPTYFEYYKINKLINKIPCHYYSLFNELSLLLNEKEYLNQFYSRLNSILFIKYSIYNLCINKPNFFPLGTDISFHLQNYYLKLNRINDLKIKEALLEDNRILYNSISTTNSKNINQNYSNILNSLFEDQSNKSFSYTFIENKTIKIKNKVKKRGEDSIKDIEDIIEKINDTEMKKNNSKNHNIISLKKKKKEEEEKEIYITKLDEKKRKNNQTNTQKYSNEKDFFIKLRRNSTRRNILENRKNQFLNSNDSKKFKSTLDFKGDLHKKENKYLSKNEVLKEMINCTRERTIDRGKLNYFSRLKDGFYNSVPDIFIGLNDFREDERIKNVFHKNNFYLKKIKNEFLSQRNKLKKNCTMKDIIKFPIIYSKDFIY